MQKLIFRLCVICDKLSKYLIDFLLKMCPKIRVQSGWGGVRSSLLPSSQSSNLFLFSQKSSRLLKLQPFPFPFSPKILPSSGSPNLLLSPKILPFSQSSNLLYFLSSKFSIPVLRGPNNPQDIVETCSNISRCNRPDKALTKYERPKMKRDA